MSTDYLLFRLYGPLASWGEVAVGEARPTELQPTRSALLGLVGAALGLRRTDEEAHAELGRALRFAVLREAAGVPLTDYHTAQVAPPRRGRRARTRADQLRAPRHELKTILSGREYRCDAVYLVAAWTEADEPRWSLRELESALGRPNFTLYLGRKSCPPSLPLAPEVVAAENLPEALRAARPLPADLGFERLFRDSAGDLFWEGTPDLGDLRPDQSLKRRDEPVSRIRWAFQNREVHHSPFPIEPCEEGADVPQ